jgi:hypothetical protein
MRHRFRHGRPGGVAAPRPVWVRGGLLGALLLLGCGHTSWPDEPGVPVEAAMIADVNAADAFLSALTARRRAADRAAPIVVFEHQAEVRTFAGGLRAGTASAAGTEKALREWARSIYGANVAAFVLDCSQGEKMALPDSLIESPSGTVLFAAAHFRPKSLAQNQCAILVVEPSGTEAVKPTSL